MEMFDVTDPAGIDMYIKLPNGDLSSKRGSCSNETIHRNHNKEFHGSNVGMQSFHDKVRYYLVQQDRFLTEISGLLCTALLPCNLPEICTLLLPPHYLLKMCHAVGHQH